MALRAAALMRSAALRPRASSLLRCAARHKSSAAAESVAEAAASKPQQQSFFRGLFSQYEAALESHPITTKSVTSGVLYGLGDAIAQGIDRYQRPEAGKGFDGPRWLRAVAYGGIFYPGIAHVHYNFLERLVVVQWATPVARVPWVKMFIEQFVYCARRHLRFTSFFPSLTSRLLLCFFTQGPTLRMPTTTPSSAPYRA